MHHASVVGSRVLPSADGSAEVPRTSSRNPASRCCSPSPATQRYRAIPVLVDRYHQFRARGIRRQAHLFGIVEHGRPSRFLEPARLLGRVDCYVPLSNAPNPIVQALVHGWTQAATQATNPGLRR